MMISASKCRPLNSSGRFCCMNRERIRLLQRLLQHFHEQKSQGWTALVLDTNANGKRDPVSRVEQKVSTAPSGESFLGGLVRI